MKIIIVGIGKLGSYLAKSLVRDNNEVTIIESDILKARKMTESEDLNYVCGSGLDPDTLIEAGIDNTDLLISVMQKDEQNLICSLLGKKMGAKNTIARIRDKEYEKSINMMKEELGLSMVINPELLTANLVSQILSIPSALNTTTFLKGKIQMISLKIIEKSKLVGITISAVNNRFDGKVIICAVEREGQTIIPKGNIRLEENDKLYVTGTMYDINNFLKYENLITGKTKTAMICGGSTTAIYLTKQLLDMGMVVKIIDIDKEKCEKLSDELPGAIVINADASSQNILYEEGIKDCDAFITMTNIDEENIIYSMFASSIGVPKIITKINHIDLDGLVNKAELDTVITSHKIASNQIVKYVRAIKKSIKSKCDAIYTFDDNSFEMLEFKVKEDFNGLNVKLKDLNLKDGILIIAINRNRNIIFPYGNDMIRKNDTIIVANSKNQIIEINDILE